MKWQEANRAWIKIPKITKRMCYTIVQIFSASAYVKLHKRPTAKFCCGVQVCHVIMLEGQNRGKGIHQLVVSWKDITSPRDSGNHQNCQVRSDRSDSDSQVGKFYIKKDQVNTPQESGYHSTNLVTGSVAPPLSRQTHTSAEKATVEEESVPLSSDAGVDEDLDGKGKSLSLKTSNTEKHPRSDHFTHLSEPDNDPEASASISVADKDGGTPVHELIKYEHSSASAVEQCGSARSSDEDTDGHHPAAAFQCRDEDAALGFPTPVSLEKAPPQDAHLSSTAGFSAASSPPPSPFPQHPPPSALKSSRLIPPTSLGPSSIHLQHGSSNELLQSISFTTSSFQKHAATTNTAKGEPQLGELATAVSKRDIAKPQQGIVSSTSLATRYRGLPEVPDGPDVDDGSSGIALTTRAEPETSAGMYSAYVIVPHAMLPARMMAGLTICLPPRYAMPYVMGHTPSYRPCIGPCTFMCVNVLGKLDHCEDTM